MQDTTSVKLQQKDKLKGKRRFELRAGRELHVALKNKNETKKFGLSVLAMNEKGKIFYVYEKRWLLLGLLSIMAMLALPVMEKFLPTSLTPYIFFIMAALFCFGLLFFLLLFRSFGRSFVFFSIYTKLPLVEFWVNKPTRSEYQAFVRQLEQSISEYRATMKIDLDRQLSGELRTLRRVTEAGLLSESVYLAAKAKLLLLSDEHYHLVSDNE